MAGVGLGLLREAAERGFRSAGQVRRELGVPCLALLPTRAAPEGDAERTEALGAVKLAIDQATGGSRPRLIGFAPAAAGDGATSTALSFAALLAAGGAATLLIDADLRDEGLTRELALSGDPGFADMLGGRSVAPVEPAPACASFPPAAIARPRRPPSPSARRRSAKPSPAPPRPSTSWWSISPRSPAASTPAPWSRHLDALVIVARWRRTERRRLRAAPRRRPRPPPQARGRHPQPRGARAPPTATTTSPPWTASVTAGSTAPLDARLSRPLEGGPSFPLRHRLFRAGWIARLDAPRPLDPAPAPRLARASSSASSAPASRPAPASTPRARVWYPAASRHGPAQLARPARRLLLPWTG